MRPVSTPGTNLTLRHPANPDATLPAQQLIVRDHDGPPQAAIMTTWQPDEGELKALLNGAPVELTVLGPPVDTTTPLERDDDGLPLMSHPPVVVEPGAPPADAKPVELLDRGHVNRAFGFLFGALRYTAPSFDYVEQTHSEQDGHLIEGGGLILQVDGFMELCARAVDATRDAPGDGPSIEDLALPSNVRGRLGDNIGGISTDVTAPAEELPDREQYEALKRHIEQGEERH